MRPHVHIAQLAALAVVATPLVASAQTFSRVLGVFNVFVGLMLTAALLTYATGFIVWVIRLGTWPSYRTEAIKIMEWSVVILFVLVVLLAIVQFFQNHPREGSYVASIIVLLLFVGIIIYLVSHSGGEKKEEKK